MTSLVIVSWSTLWLFQLNLLSHFQHSTANLVALVIGYSLVSAVFLLDRHLGRIRSKLANTSFVAALAFEDLVTFIAWFYLGFLWRGAWLTAASVVRVLDSDMASAWLSFGIGVAGLGVCRCSQWPDALGCAVDGSRMESKAMFGVSMLKLWRETSKSAKNAERKDAEEVRNVEFKIYLFIF